MKNAFGTFAACFVVSALLALVGCGSDSSSEDPVKDDPLEQPEDSEKAGKNPDENSETDPVSDPDDEKDYVQSQLESSGDFSIDTVRDARYGTYSYWLRTGNIVWSLETVTDETDEVKSVCYDNQKGNCDDYGRLFTASAKPAHAACPEGQNLASSSDWALLDTYRLKHAEIDKLLGLKYGGLCVKAADSLECSGIDTTGNYLTSDGKVYSIKKGTSTASTSSAKTSGYYNVRCIAYPTFVKSVKDLPACDPSLKNPPELIYVFDEKENYRCYPVEKKWFPDFTESCTTAGKTIVFDNTMMVCEDRIWQYADVSYSPEECDSENKGKILVFNGEKYACSGSRWRRFTDLEDTLGVCNDRKSGTFDTLYTGSTIRPYYCNGSSWEEATIEIYKGDCLDSSSKNMYDTIDFKNELFVCRGNGWEEYTDLEKQFGVCVPRKLFMFENGSYDVDDYHTEYLCDTTGWKKFVPNDIIGGCDSTERGWYTVYRDKHYYCNSYGTWMHLGGMNTDLPQDSMHVCSQKNPNRIVSGDYEKVSMCIRSSSTDSTKLSIATHEFPKCDKSNEGEEYVYGKDYWTVKAYCGGSGYWNNYYDDLEKCTTKNLGKFAESKEFGSVGCDVDGWRTVNSLEKIYGLCGDRNEDEIVEKNGKKVICYWREWSGYKDKSTYRVNGSKGEGK